MQTFVPREEFDILLEILWQDPGLQKQMKERKLLPPGERQRLVKLLQKEAREQQKKAPAPPGPETIREVKEE